MNLYHWQSPYSSFTFGSSLTKAVKVIIIINVALFILIHLLSNLPWLYLFGLVPSFVFGKLKIWQLVTYMFLHVGLWHLVVNMLMLWFFAPAIEASWGRRQFLFYYFFSGIGAGLCSWITAFHSSIPVIGASGAIFGILVAYAMMFPETIILLFFFFPMKIKHAVLLLAGINLLGALSSPNAGIAYFAHLGGGLFGYLYLKSEWIRLRLSYWNWPKLKSWHGLKSARRSRPERQVPEGKVDSILDKVSKHGIESLTSKEKRMLDEESRKI